MRVTDQLANDKRREEEKKKKKRGWDFEDIQMDRPTRIQRRPSINDGSNVFSSVMEKGINTSKSLFDETAVFHVKNSK